MSKLGITGGDSSFDLATVDGQTCYVRLTVHGLLSAVVLMDTRKAVINAVAMLICILDTLSLPLLIDCRDDGYCYSVDTCSERGYTSGAGASRVEVTR